MQRVDPGPRPPMPERVRMEDIDFRPVSNIIFLILFVPIFLAFGCFGVIMAVDDLSSGFNAVDAAGWTVAFSLYLLFVWFILTWLTFTWRTRFTDEGIHRWTFTRRYFVPWDTIVEAAAGQHKGSIELVLRYGPKKRRLHLMLTDYRRARRLFDEMERRMNVPIQIAPYARAALRDD